MKIFLKVRFEIFAVLFVMMIFCIVPVNANTQIKLNSLPFDPNSPPWFEPVDGFDIVNITEYLSSWNEKMKWGLNEQQIKANSIMLEEVLKKSQQKKSNFYRVKNLTKFSEELQYTIGLTKKQRSAL